MRLFTPPTVRHTILISLLTSPVLLAQAAGFSAQTVISTSADRAKDVYAIDLDGDGDIDVLSASALDDKIAWYENQLSDVPTLVATPPTLSASIGGTSSLQFQAGVANAGKPYLIVTSGAGSMPGTTLPGGLFVPLVIDSLTIQGLNNANNAPFFNFLGFLDGAGQATATFGPFTPAVLAPLIGFEATFAGLTLDQTFSSNAVQVTVTL